MITSRALIFSLFFVVLGTILKPVEVRAQNESGAYYEVSNLFHERVHNFTCEYVESAVKRIKNQREEDLKEELETEAQNLQALQNETSDEKLQQDLSYLSHQMKSAAGQKSPKVTLTKALEKLCLGTVKPLVFASRGVSLGNSVLLNTATFPLASFVSFWNGVFSRKKTELGKRDDFIYRAFGPKKNVSSYLLGIIATEGTNFLLTPNPALTVLNASIAIEMITNYRCFHVNRENEDQVKFCDTYADLKDFYHRGYEKSFKVGQKLQKLIDQKIIEKRANYSPEKFCGLSKKKQVKLAKHALTRHTYLYQDPRISGIHVILPVHKNSCTKILLYSENQENLASLKNEKTFLEGIEFIHLKKDTFPSDLYFTTNDLKAMSFEDSLCYEAETLYYNQFLASKMALTLDMLKSSLAPSLLATPSSSKVIMTDELIRQGETQNLKNLIFSLAPSEAERTLALKLKHERKETVKRIKRDYKQTINSKSFSNCKRTLIRREVDLNEFQDDLARINEIAQEKSLQIQMEFEVIEKFFNKEQKHLKLDWELIHTNNLQDITAALQSKEVANIIIISHGKDSGHLVDSKGQELPREAFTNISPTIQSLNFYSCFSKKLIDLYALQTKMNSLPSYYKIRYLTNVSENEFMGETNFAPMSAFGYYLSQLDRYLFDASKGAHLLQQRFGTEFSVFQEEKQCQIDSSDVVIEKGSYALTLNEQMVGTMDESNTHGIISFPCSLLRAEKNTLKIKNIINTGGSVIKNLNDFNLNIENHDLNAKSASLLKNSMVIFKF